VFIRGGCGRPHTFWLSVLQLNHDHEKENVHTRISNRWSGLSTPRPNPGFPAHCRCAAAFGGAFGGGRICRFFGRRPVRGRAGAAEQSGAVWGGGKGEAGRVAGGKGRWKEDDPQRHRIGHTSVVLTGGRTGVGGWRLAGP